MCAIWRSSSLPTRTRVASREWAREHSLLPVLICVASDIAQERRVQRVAQDTLTQSAGLIVWTTTEALFNEHGPLSPSGYKVFHSVVKLQSRADYSDTACTI